jgi:hypothetical protein
MEEAPRIQNQFDQKVSKRPSRTCVGFDKLWLVYDGALCVLFHMLHMNNFRAFDPELILEHGTLWEFGLKGRGTRIRTNRHVSRLSRTPICCT